MEQVDKKALTREKILKAALECFAEKGFKETSVDEIAQKAGVSKGNIYWHFKSKFDIFMEIIREEVKKVHDLISEEENFSLPLNELWKLKAEKAFLLIRKLEKQLKIFYEVVFSSWKEENAKKLFFEIERENLERHKRLLEKELQVRNIRLSPTDLENISRLLNMFHQAVIFRILLLLEDKELWNDLKDMIYSFIDILSFYIYKRGEESAIKFN